MRRFTMVLAAAIATATLVTAATALDAVGADPPPKSSAEDGLIGELADCLRDRGAAVPALEGAALERWLQASRLADADVRACKRAVAPRIERHEASAGKAGAISPEDPKGSAGRACCGDDTACGDRDHGRDGRREVQRR